MKKYIDRDEFVKRLNENVELTNPEEQEWVKDECIRQAHAMPSVNVGEWISMKERVPEKDGYYITLALCSSSGVIPMRFVTTTVRGQRVRRWEWNGRISPWLVTHWMPMPEPPKGE